MIHSGSGDLVLSVVHVVVQTLTAMQRALGIAKRPFQGRKH